MFHAVSIALWSVLLLTRPALTTSLDTERSFLIDYENNTFRKDGFPFRYVSGSIHYMRVHPKLWRDRLLKLRDAGFNTIQFYVEWNHHEPLPGQFDFSGRKDVEVFIDMAHSLGLLVILRAGPYICGERDGGGMPFWLRKLHPDIKWRTSDKNFLARVDSWWDELLPRMRPLLYENGGPVIMVQLENEYGWFGTAGRTCDVAYLQHLRDKLREKLGDKVILFTTDGSSKTALRCGKINGAYATVDFGPGTDPNEAFRLQRLVEPRGPLVNSEFYPGWFDDWGAPHHTASVNKSAEALDAILRLKANVNVYMAHGGTNFGFESGAGFGPPYMSITTSYDYDAPVSEAGVKTAKYQAFKEVIGKFVEPRHGAAEVPSSQARAYGKVRMSFASSFFTARGTEGVLALAGSTPGETPPTFADLWQSAGFALYETRLEEQFSQPAMLAVDGLADRGYVFLNQVPQGVLSRGDLCTKMPLMTRKGDTLQILVENQGRVGYGEGEMDSKGIVGKALLGAETLKGWAAYSMPLNDTKALTSYVHNVSASQKTDAALLSAVLEDLESTRGWSAFWWGRFRLPCNATEAADTFLRLDGWRKGVAFVNGFNLGRYWPAVGPQMTLYVPGPVLLPRCQTNEIILFEQEKPVCLENGMGRTTCEVNLVDKQVLDGPTPVKQLNLHSHKFEHRHGTESNEIQ